MSISLGLSCLEFSCLPGSVSLFPSPFLGKFSAIISSNMISASFLLSFPPGSSLNWALVHLILSHKTLKVSPIFFFIFFIFMPHSVSSKYLSLSSQICSFLSSSLLLNTSSLFFSSITIFFSFMISVYIYCLFFLEFSFCSYIALLTLVSIFMTIILNSLSGKSLISIH